MLRKLYRLDDAARRTRVRVLTVTFTIAFAIIMWMIISDFFGHRGAISRKAARVPCLPQ
jgi:hypothetical protein